MDMAERVARAIQYPSLRFVDDPAMPQYRPELPDAVALLNGGFAWPKPHAGVWLYDGVGELDLAAVLEVYGATWSYQIDTLADGPAITSQHGLRLIPRWRIPSLPKVDRLLVPGGRGVARVAAALAPVREQLGAPFPVLAEPGRRGLRTRRRWKISPGSRTSRSRALPRSGWSIAPTRCG